MAFNTAAGFAPHKVVSAVIIVLVALITGYFLADAPIYAILLAGGAGWLLTLPYHGRISVYLATATFGSAFIVPFLPGRPYLWEVAALLGWTGLLLTLVFRREHPAMSRMLRENKWLYLGVVGYCGVLLVTMYYRGVGFRILGGDQMGGRFYFQQLIVAVFPFLLAAIPTSEKALTRLFYLQCLLASTFILSELAFTFNIAPGVLLSFFELSSDAMNFERQADQFGIRRYQSLAFTSAGVLYFLWARIGLKPFFSHRGLYLIPIAVAVLGLGLLGGHRLLLITLVFVFAGCAFAQRFINPRNGLILLATVVAMWVAIYFSASALPLSAQRAVSFLPGIDVHQVADRDASGTWFMRRELVRYGFGIMPEYFWVGRGLGYAATATLYANQTQDHFLRHVVIGRYYNGFVGMMVNTGVFGTAFMLLFLWGGTVLAWRIIRLLRSQQWEDHFALVCSVIAALWMGRLVVWLFLHGDSEWALRNFSLLAAMLVACHHLLNQRMKRSGEPAGKVAGLRPLQFGGVAARLERGS